MVSPEFSVLFYNHKFETPVKISAEYKTNKINVVVYSIRLI